MAAHPDLTLVALFAAEHGIRGIAAAGEKISDERDAKTGVPIFSLYMAEDRGPTPEMLKNVEAIPAIRFHITDREKYQPVRTALVLIDEIRRAAPGGLRMG